MRILLDADFLVALSKVDDVNHNGAVNQARDLTEHLIFITPLTLPEAVTVLSYKVSQTVAKNFLLEARKRNFIELPLDQLIEEETDQVFLAQNTKGISWLDCLNIAMIKTYGLDGILSFDRFYKKFGIKIISRIND